MESIIRCNSHVRGLADGTIERFENLLKIAIDLKLERVKFQDCCNNWCYATGQASMHITEIEKELIKVNLATNCATLGGASTAILGTVMGIAGVSLALPTGGASLALLGGTSAAAIGGGVSIGSHVIKHKLSRTLCEKAKKALDSTIYLTDKLEEQRTAYFDTLFKFKEHLENITETELEAASFQLDEWSSLREFEFDEDTKKGLLPTAERMRMMKPAEKKSKEERVLMLIGDIIKVISEDPLAKKLLRLIEKSDLAKALLPSIDLSSAFRNTEERAKFIVQSTVAVYNLAKESKLTIKTTLKSMSKTIRIGLGLLNVLFLAWEMFDLVTTSINVHHGSKSDESKQLSRIAKDMKEYREEVMRVLKEVFNWDFSSEKSW